MTKKNTRTTRDQQDLATITQQIMAEIYKAIADVLKAKTDAYLALSKDSDDLVICTDTGGSVLTIQEHAFESAASMFLDADAPLTSEQRLHAAETMERVAAQIRRFVETGKAPPRKRHKKSR